MKHVKSLALLMALVLMVAMFAGCTAAETASTTTTSTTTEATATEATAAEATTTEAAEETDAATGAQPYKIGLSIMELTAYTWYQGAISGCEQWQEENGAANGVEFSFVVEDSHSDVSAMLTNIENMVTAGCDGIILFPADASSAIPTMKLYTEQGIPFVIGDYEQIPNAPEDAVWSTFVGHDMRALGQISGKEAVKYIDTLGIDDPVCLFITVPSDGQSAVDRYNGFAETILAAYPNATIIEEGDTGGNSRDSSQTLAENVYQREPVVNVVSGHNDSAVVGAYNAAVQQGRTEIKFIGIAGDKDVLTWISQGNEAWLAEVLQDPVDLGYQSAEAMYRSLVLNEDLPDNWDLPDPIAVTNDNISEYDWENWAWLG